MKPLVASISMPAARSVLYASAAACVLLGGCAHAPGGSFARELAARPLPPDAAALRAECAALHAESERQIDRYNRAELRYWGLVRTIERVHTEANVDALQARGTRIGCAPP